MKMANTPINTGGITLRDILPRYFKYWKWIVLSIFICLCIGVLYSYTCEYSYKVSTCIMLNQENNQYDSKLEPLSINAKTSKLDLANEILNLSTPDIMNVVADALDLDVSYSTKNLFGRHDYLYSESPYKVYLTKTEDADCYVSMSISKDENSYQIEGTCWGGESASFNKEVKELPVTISLPNNIGTISVGLSGKQIQKKTYYVDIYPITEVAKNLSGSILVEQTSAESAVLLITLFTENAEKGAAILEELIRIYNENAANEKSLMAYNTSTFINDRLKDISNELGNVEDEMVEFKQRNRIADLNSEATLYMQQSGEYEKQRGESETQLRIISMVEQFVSENKDKAIPSLGVTDPTLESLISDYNNKVISNERLLKSTSENAPSRIRMQKELETIRYSILASIQNERKSIRITLANINSHGSSANYRLQSIPQQERGLLEKERQQQVIESLFLFLMQRREETNVAMVSAIDKAKVIISPEASAPPVAPNKRVILFSFFMLGLAIPLIIITIKDFFRTNVEGKAELQRLSHVNIMGEICNNPASEQIVIFPGAATHTAELFRRLRNNIDYFFNHQTHKAIIITSSIEDEGKSFISINLALSFALTGRSVLLVDIDMRKSNLSKYLQSKTDKGLTNYLNKETEHWEDYVERMDEHSELHILKAGETPINPNELLMGDNFKKFIEEARAKYDYVVMDSSPLGIVSDSAIAAEFTDLTLYVVRDGKTPRSMLSIMNEEENKRRLKNIHIVFNDAKIAKHIYKNAYYTKKI